MANNEMRLNEKQIIRAALNISGKTQKAVSEQIGINPATLKNQLCRPESTMSLTSVYKLLTAMGFEIVIRDKGGAYGGQEFTISGDTSPIEAKLHVSNELKANLPKAEPRKPVQALPERKMVRLPSNFTSDHVRDARLSELMAEGGEVTAEE